MFCLQNDLGFGTFKRMRQPRLLLDPDFGILDSVIYLTLLHVGITLQAILPGTHNGDTSL